MTRIELDSKHDDTVVLFEENKFNNILMSDVKAYLKFSQFLRRPGK
jgi:hypothetical protein